MKFNYIGTHAYLDYTGWNNAGFFITLGIYYANRDNSLILSTLSLEHTLILFTLGKYAQLDYSWNILYIHLKHTIYTLETYTDPIDTGSIYTNLITLRTYTLILITL